MGYLAAIFILWNIIYIASFAKYNIEKKNNTAAAGSIILIFLIIAVPLMVMFIK